MLLLTLISTVRLSATLLVVLLSLQLAEPVSSQLQQLLALDEENTRTKIAIIGAGAGGSSAAYYLQKYTNSSFDITIFEQSGYIGGRSTTIANIALSEDHPGLDNYTSELGASIFVSANKILMNAVDEFGLVKMSSKASEKNPEVEISGTFGIWDGETFRFISSHYSWWTSSRILHKYGIAPIKAKFLNKKVVQTFLDSFYLQDFPFRNLDWESKISGLDELTNLTGSDYLHSNNIGERFANDFIQAATRANYAANLNYIHALGTMVSLATDDTFQVQGGNYKIFESFIESSKAKLKLNTPVKEIAKIGEKWLVKYLDKGSERVEKFDQVIVAAPYDLSSIKLGANIPPISTEPVKYVKLYTTLFSTKKKITGRGFFNVSFDAPDMVLTTLGPDGEGPGFFSINIVDYKDDTKEFIYKVFSPHEISIDWLYSLYDLPENAAIEESISNTDLKIVYKKIWRSYPILEPTDSFDGFEVDSGLWYLNTMERFISTMETSCLSGANVAALISTGLNSTELVIP